MPPARSRPRPLTNRDLAAADLKRYRDLREQNFISGAELERRETTCKAAQAQLEQAQAQLASQGNQASYTTLVADVPGVVTAIEAEPGQVVVGRHAGGAHRAGRRARRGVRGAGRPARPLIKPGSAVDGARLGRRRRTWQGKVREVAASADAGHPHLHRQGGDRCRRRRRRWAPPSTRGRRRSSRSGTPVIKLPTSALRQEGQGTRGLGARQGHA